MSRQFILRHEPDLDRVPSFTLDYEGELNAQQYQAATAGSGPYLVVAGAGTGKTRTLIFRVAYLVESGVAPEHVVLLTFTRRAAREMLARASRLLDGRCERVQGGTFHAFCLLILRRFSEQAGYPPNFTILDSSDAADVVDVVRTTSGLHRSQKRFPRKATLHAMFSMAINRDMTLAEVIEHRYPQFADSLEGVERLASDYREYKSRHGLMDYDDLLLHTASLLDRDAGIRRAVAERCRHVLVDEYQDTNLLQARLVELFGSVHGNVMVVGDDAQSIYHFRGANPDNIFDFPDHFDGARVLRLEHNYRSTQQILNLANHLITQASRRYEKELFSERADGDLPGLVAASDDQTECRFVCQMISQLREEGLALSRIAVLFRSGFNSYALEIELNRRNIPFVKYGGVKLSEAAHVKDVIAHLKVAENPKDASAWTRILVLLEGVGSKTAQEIIEWVTSNEGEPFALDEKPFSPRYVESLVGLFSLLRSVRSENLSLEQQVEAVLGYYEPILKRKYFEDFPKRQQDLEHFAGLTTQFGDRASFLESLALDPIELTVLEAEAGVEDEPPLVLSTIHSAKGLEFDTVFVIQALEGILPSAYSLKDPEALDEELRLLYVAVTRAERNLFVSYPVIQHRRFDGEYFARPSRYIEGVDESILEPIRLAEADSGSVGGPAGLPPRPEDVARLPF
jgi:DNA helicase-2/ATP-dependent DNA helicase PcrA